MTDDEMRVKIAEACGVIECDEWSPFIAGASMIKNETCGHVKCVPRGMLPDYLNDLNAMHEAEKTLTVEQWISYWSFIESQLPKDGSFSILHATARQRAEAFLAVI